PQPTARSVSHRPPSHTMPITAGSPAAATRMRDQNELMGRVRTPRTGRSLIARQSCSSSAEPPSPPRVRCKRLAQIVWPEVGPVAIDENQLRIGELPEEEVRYPQLAGGPDQQVGVGHVWRVEV